MPVCCRMKFISSSNSTADKDEVNITIASFQHILTNELHQICACVKPQIGTIFAIEP